MAGGPLRTARKSMRELGYRLAHTLLPAGLRRAVRKLFGGPSRYDEVQAQKKAARAIEKAERKKVHQAAAEARDRQREEDDARRLEVKRQRKVEKTEAKAAQTQAKQEHARAKAEREAAKAEWATMKAEGESAQAATDGQEEQSGERAAQQPPG